MVAGICGEKFEQLRTDPSPLVLVGYRKGNLGDLGVVALTVISADSDELAVEHNDQRHPVVVVDIREELDLIVAQGLLDLEEPEITGFGAQSLEEGAELIAVIGLDGPHPGTTTVLEDNVELILRGITGHRTLSLPGAQVSPHIDSA